MNPEQFRRMEALYDAAVGMDPADRNRFLEQSCGDDEELRRELLAVFRDAGSGFKDVVAHAAARVVPSDVPQPDRVGRYEVVGRLGEGGMGILYLARDPLLGRPVAIKVLSAHTREMRERFAREARSAASLKHNHIITIYDVGEDDSRPFIAMEYIEGETLAEVIRRRAALSLDRRLHLMLELCVGLAYAHGRGIIHRDIKPANLMIASDGVLKILDFGLARVMGDLANTALTNAGMLLGTMHYMSPEQIEGRRVDQRSDIFAVGLVIYEFVTYSRAFSGDTPHSVMNRIMSSEPPPMSEHCQVEPRLQAIVERAIRKSPDDRYQELSALIADLTPVRESVRAHANEATIISAAPLQASPSDRPRSDRLAAPTPTPPPQIPNLEALSRRRANEIDTHLSQAVQHFELGELETAMERCEMAVVLDPAEMRALDLLQRIHLAMEDRQVEEWLTEARRHFNDGALTQAEETLNRALQLRPWSSEGALLRARVEAERENRARVKERARAAQEALERARAKLAERAFEAALRAATEVLVHDPASAEARALQTAATESLAEQRREEEFHRRVSETVDRGRDLAARGQFSTALELLRAFSPAHALVDQALEDVKALQIADEKRRAAEKQRRLAEEQRQQEEQQARERRARTLDEERRRRAAEEEQRRRAAEEEQRRRAAAEEQRRRAADEEQRRRAADEARRREQARRDEAAAAERRRLADLERRRAEKAAHSARRLFDSGDREGAFRLLAQFEPAALVQPVIQELQDEEARVAREEHEPGSFRTLHTERDGMAVVTPSPATQPAVSSPPTAVAARVADSGRARRRLTAVVLAGAAAALVFVGIVRYWSSQRVQPASSAETASVAGTEKLPSPATVAGTVVLDALPWAEVVSIASADGSARPLSPNTYTPVALSLTSGEYDVTLRHGSTQTIRVRVTAGEAVRPSPVDFGRIEAVEYFRGLGW